MLLLWPFIHSLWWISRSILPWQAPLLLWIDFGPCRSWMCSSLWWDCRCPLNGRGLWCRRGCTAFGFRLLVLVLCRLLEHGLGWAAPEPFWGYSNGDISDLCCSGIETCCCSLQFRHVAFGSLISVVISSTKAGVLHIPEHARAGVKLTKQKLQKFEWSKSCTEEHIAHKVTKNPMKFILPSDWALITTPRMPNYAVPQFQSSKNFRAKSHIWIMKKMLKVAGITREIQNQNHLGIESNMQQD